MSSDDFSIHLPGWTGETFTVREVTAPFDGSVVGCVPEVDAAAMAHALSVARETLEDRDGWLPGHRRAEILETMADLVHERAEELALLIAREGGKPLKDARVEMARAQNGLRLCAVEATRLHGEQIPMSGTPAAEGHLAFTLREPIGVVAALSAFNHPFNLIVHQVGPAVASGCPVLVKPASATPLSCVRFVELLHEAGLPPRWAMCVPCGNDVAEQLATSPDIAFLTFIGSAKVGWMLRSKLAPGVRAAMEHGGAAPVVLDESADVADAVPLLLKGGYYHAGQVCVSVQRVFVHTSRATELKEGLLRGIAALKTGDPTDAATDVGPLIRAGEVDRVHQWVRDAVAAGAQLLCGGEPLPNQCYAPTLLWTPPVDSDVMQQEIFGPVVCVREVQSLDEAIALANGVPWDFQAAVFAQDIDAALWAADRLKGAAVMVNDHTAFRVDWMPFGGHGPSGLSLGGIPHAVRDMTREKLIVLRHKRK